MAWKKPILFLKPFVLDEASVVPDDLRVCFTLAFRGFLTRLSSVSTTILRFSTPLGPSSTYALQALAAGHHREQSRRPAQDTTPRCRRFKKEADTKPNPTILSLVHPSFSLQPSLSNDVPPTSTFSVLPTDLKKIGFFRRPQSV